MEALPGGGWVAGRGRMMEIRSTKKKAGTQKCRPLVVYEPDTSECFSLASRDGASRTRDGVDLRAALCRAVLRNQRAASATPGDGATSRHRGAAGGSTQGGATGRRRQQDGAAAGRCGVRDGDFTSALCDSKTADPTRSSRGDPTAVKVFAVGCILGHRQLR